VTALVCPSTFLFSVSFIRPQILTRGFVAASAYLTGSVRGLIGLYSLVIGIVIDGLIVRASVEGKACLAERGLNVRV